MKIFHYANIFSYYVVCFNFGEKVFGRIKISTVYEVINNN